MKPYRKDKFESLYDERQKPKVKSFKKGNRQQARKTIRRQMEESSNEYFPHEKKYFEKEHEEAFNGIL